MGIGDSPHLDDSLFVKSLEQSKLSAYKSVSNPVEGTMLTVISRIYDIAYKSIPDVSGLTELLEIIVKEANKTVKETQFMLPVLEKAGVVEGDEESRLAAKRVLLDQVNSAYEKAVEKFKVPQPKS